MMFPQPTGRRPSQIAVASVFAIALSACAATTPPPRPEWSDIEKVCGNPFLDYACTYDARKAMLAEFGIPPLDALHARKSRKGETGGAVVALSHHNANSFALLFERKANHGPMVEFSGWARTKTGKRHRRFKANISEADWQELITKGAGFDTPTYDDSLCVCGSIFVVEALDDSGNIRARVNQSCVGTPSNTYLEILADIAARNLPQCAPREPEDGLDAIGLLLDCAAIRRKDDD